jgi:hypothetical protein
VKKAHQPLAGQLLIHTGDHKAGSTAIQEGLTRGDVTLAEGSIAYPLGNGQFNHNGIFTRKPGKRRGTLVAKVLNQLTSSKPREEAFAQFARRARRAQADLTVLSAENLESVDPRRLAAALAQHLPTAPGQLTIVTYLRPHTPRLISGLAERIKIGWANQNPWQGVEMIARVRRRYAPRTTAWREVFGAAYHVRPMIRSELVGGAVLDDLMTTALGPNRATVTHNRGSNVSLPVEDLMRLHVVHTALPHLDRQQHLRLGWHLADNIEMLRPPGGSATPLRADKALAERMRRNFQADAAAVDAAWFGGKPLLQEALDQAVDGAVAEQMPLDPAAWLDSGEIAALKERAPEFAALVADKAARAQLRADRLAKILRDDQG